MRKKTLSTAILALLCCIACVFACACKQKFTLTFDANGGENIKAVQLTKGVDYTLPTPTKNGFEFEGWYMSSDFSGQAVTSYKAEGNVTFYAKWQAYAKVTLDANGGTLSTSQLTLKVGANIYDSVNSIVPEKTGAQFYGWYNGDRLLSQNTKLSEAGVTLTAKYKYAYSVEVYVQDLNDSKSYVKETTAVTGYEFENESFKPSVPRKGLVQVSNANEKTSGPITSNASENVFKLYFDRKKVSVSFDLNYENAPELEGKSVTYGQSVTVPSYLREGYLLIGWSTQVDGKVEYQTDSITPNLYSGAHEVENQSFVPEESLTLYAVWSKAYTDMFGGSDDIYLIEKTSDSGKTSYEVYLYRGEFFFKGEYLAKSNAFIFQPDPNKENSIFEGKFVSDDYYVYSDANRKSEYVLYYLTEEGGADFNENVILAMDESTGVTYTETDEDGNTDQSKGNYSINDEGYYVVTFTEGSLQGESFTYIYGSTTKNGKRVYVFQKRNEDEYLMGKLLRYQVVNGSLMAIPETSGYYLTLNGFGVAYITVGSQTQGLYYTLSEDNVLTLRSSQGTTQMVAKIIENNGIKGYIVYTSSIEHTYVSGNAQLMLDGMYNAVYTDENGNKYEGVYVTNGSSVFGTAKISMYYGGGKQLTFILSSAKDEEGVISYSFQLRSNTYAEYYFMEGESLYRSPLFVFDENESGTITVYGYTEKASYEKIAFGYYVLNENGLYDFVIDKTFAAEGLIGTYTDFSAIKSIKFAIDTTSTDYSIQYWYSYVSENEAQEDVTTDNTIVYTDAEGVNGTLTLIGAMAVYKSKDATYSGLYSTSKGITTLSAVVTSGTQTTTVSFLFELNEQKDDEGNVTSRTYIVYQYSPYTAYAVTETSAINQKEYIAFDGKGKATYTLVSDEKDEEGNAITTQYVGTVTQTTEKTGSLTVYMFEGTAEGLGTTSFKLITLSTSSGTFFAKEKTDLQGEYTTEQSGAKLTLDGYLVASYKDANGNNYNNAMYFVNTVDEQKQIVFIYGSYYLYFDIVDQATKTFTLRGSEYGTWLLTDNQGTPGIYLQFDGYGKAVVITFEKDADGNFKLDEDNQYIPVKLDENAVYELKDNGKCVLTYLDNGVKKTLVGKLGTMTGSSSTLNVFILIHEEVEMTYVNPADWSVITLTSIGNATRYNGKTGKKETGAFKLITESLFYFVTSDGTDACIYEYDNQTKTAVIKQFDERGYYTENLSALYFSKYGFANFTDNDTDRDYYYNVDENGNVIMYYQDSMNSDANQYGFVRDDSFGKFVDENSEDMVEKQWAENTYYLTQGRTITFKRNAEDGADKYYPVAYNSKITKAYFAELKFVPSGEEEFSITAIATMVQEDGTQIADIQCVVVREWEGEGEDKHLATYISLNYFRFDITLVYKGDVLGGETLNNYTIDKMSWSIEVDAYTYAYYSAIINLFNSLGMNLAPIENTFGHIELYAEYNTDGEISTQKVLGEIYEDSGLKDLNGELLTIAENVAYETIGTSYYAIHLTSTDGYDYRLIFNVESILSSNGYKIYALTRTSKFDFADGEDNCSVEIEQIVATETQSVTIGSIFDVRFFDKEGKKIDVQGWFNGLNEDGTVNKKVLYCVARTYDEGKKNIVSSVYYRLNLTLKEDTSVTEGETSSAVMPYETAEVQKIQMRVVYALTTAHDTFIEIDESTHQVMLYVIGNNSYLIKSCEYNQAEDSYTVVTRGNADYKFTIKMTENGVEYIEVE